MLESINSGDFSSLPPHSDRLLSRIQPSVTGLGSKSPKSSGFEFSLRDKKTYFRLVTTLRYRSGEVSCACELNISMLCDVLSG